MSAISAPTATAVLEPQESVVAPAHVEGVVPVVQQAPLEVEASKFEAPGSKITDPAAAPSTEAAATSPIVVSPTTGSVLKESTSVNEPAVAGISTSASTPVVVEGEHTANAAQVETEGVKASPSVLAEPTAATEVGKEDIKEKKDSPKKDKKPGFLSRLIAQFSHTADKVEHKVEHKKEKKSPKVEKTEAAATAPSAAAEPTALVVETEETSEPAKETGAPAVAPAVEAPVVTEIEPSTIPSATSEAVVAPEPVEPVASTSEVKTDEAPATSAKSAVSPKMNRRLSARVSDLFKTHIGGPKKEKSTSFKKDEVVGGATSEAVEGAAVTDGAKADEIKVSDSAPVLDAPATNAPIALGEVVPAAEHQEEPVAASSKPEISSV